MYILVLQLVERLFLVVPRGCLRFVIVVFHDHTYLLFLQSSWWGRESWLICLICIPGVSWWLSGSSLRCHGTVCCLWLWYFLIILTYHFLLNKTNTTGNNAVEKVALEINYHHFKNLNMTNVDDNQEFCLTITILRMSKSLNLINLFCQRTLREQSNLLRIIIMWYICNTKRVLKCWTLFINFSILYLILVSFLLHGLKELFAQMTKIKMIWKSWQL